MKERFRIEWHSAGCFIRHLDSGMLCGFPTGSFFGHPSIRQRLISCGVLKAAC